MVSKLITDFLPRNFTFKTIYQERYEELVDEMKLFSKRLHLCTTALAIGVLLNKKSSASRKSSSDLIRLPTISDEVQLLFIETMARIGCKSDNKTKRGTEVNAFAEGGIEWIWKEYKILNSLDFSKIVQEMRKKCEQQVSDFLEETK